MVRCVLSQLKPSGFSILSCEKELFFTVKNVEFLGLYPSLSAKKCILYMFLEFYA